MSKFFKRLVSENLIFDWAEILDWIFDDLKFSIDKNWSKGYVGSFTKRVKKLFNNENFICKRIIHTDFPNQSSKKSYRENKLIMMVNDSSEARALIRHIRNGIAHGQTTIHNIKSELYIEILDYSDKNKSLDKQTAYIFIPLSNIIEFYKIYKDINTSINKRR